MENATKALIIAGAVLVSILLISIGVALINNNKNTTDAAKNTSEALGTKASSTANDIGTKVNNLTF